MNGNPVGAEFKDRDTTRLKLAEERQKERREKQITKQMIQWKKSFLHPSCPPIFFDLHRRCPRRRKIQQKTIVALDEVKALADVYKNR